MRTELSSAVLAHVASPNSLASDASAASDGTIWSHAATKGTRQKGGFTFTIDDGMLESFVTNFNHGYPAKVPVDYDHGTTNGVANGANIVPKAGDVFALKAVKSAADITPEIQAQIDKMNGELAAIGVTSKVDPLGLWMRWRPTSRALSYIKAREYTELSIAFDDDWPNQSGIGQGPTLLAVALCNRPYLDDMVSVAASHGAIAVRGGNGADSPEDDDMSDDKRPATFWAQLSAAFKKPVSTDAEIASSVTALTTELQAEKDKVTQLTSYRDVVSAELGNETDPIKAVTKIREISTARDAAQASLTSTAGSAIETTAEATMIQHEKKLSAPLRKMMKSNLIGELTAGKKVEDTETVKTLKEMPELKELSSQTALGDSGSNGGKDLTDEAIVHNRAKELQSTDPVIKELMTTNRNEGITRSYTQAENERLTARSGKK